ncbi:ferredoxin [Desulfogranum japonicum]|uniref:ferredoxin n=1 Tax=Desulfogranum japonicum TaxID=231447 RepID=UPI00040DA2DF|nr:ferredoxin [Desulfogranum japonicum]
MAKPVVDQELCIGCEICVDLCPEVFEIQDGKSYVIGPDKCSSCDCQEAVDSCPTSAIELEED